MFDFFYIFFDLTIDFISYFIVLGWNPIYSIVGLIFIFIWSSFELVEMNLVFFAIVFLAVYLGAIVVLFLFVVMMLEIKTRITTFSKKKYQKIFFFTIFFIMFSLLFFFETFTPNIVTTELNLQENQNFFKNHSKFLIKDSVFGNFWQTVETYSQVYQIGQHMFQISLLSFLFCGLLLFIAMVGAIVLTFEPLRSKFLLQQEASIQTNKNINITGFWLKK